MSDIYKVLNALAYAELDELGIPRSVLNGVYGMFYEDSNAGLLKFYSFDKEEDDEKKVYRIKTFRIKIADAFEDSLFMSLAIMYHEIYHLKKIYENGMVEVEKKSPSLWDRFKGLLLEWRADFYGYRKAIINYRLALEILKEE